MFKKYRPLISVVLLLAFLGIAADYLAKHHNLLNQLSKTPLSVSIIVFALYIVMFGVLVLILRASLVMCQTPIKWIENSMLNSHSLFINFFIPGQGGPAYRGLYLTKRHHLKIKTYIAVTLIYYAFYAAISVLFLLMTNRPWWQTLLGVIAASAFSWYVIRRYNQKLDKEKISLKLNARNLLYLGGVTVLQCVVQTIIYMVELHSINHHINISQAITYTGAANLALFVSLTPGAIGIRESFLLFTRHLHHISSSNIIVANLIDRSVYIVFLLILLVLAVGLHLKNKDDPLYKIL